MHSLVYPFLLARRNQQGNKLSFILIKGEGNSIQQKKTNQKRRNVVPQLDTVFCKRIMMFSACYMIIFFHFSWFNNSIKSVARLWRQREMRKPTERLSLVLVAIPSNKMLKVSNCFSCVCARAYLCFCTSNAVSVAW